MKTDIYQKLMNLDSIYAAHTSKDSQPSYHDYHILLGHICMAVFLQHGRMVSPILLETNQFLSQTIQQVLEDLGYSIQEITFLDTNTSIEFSPSGN